MQHVRDTVFLALFALSILALQVDAVSKAASGLLTGHSALAVALDRPRPPSRTASSPG